MPGVYVLNYRNWEDNGYSHYQNHWSPAYLVDIGTDGFSHFQDGIYEDNVESIYYDTVICGDGFVSGNPFNDEWFGEHGGAYVDGGLFSYTITGDGKHAQGSGDPNGIEGGYDPWEYEIQSDGISIDEIDDAGSGTGHGTINGGAHYYTGTDKGTAFLDFYIPLPPGSPCPNQPFDPPCPCACSGGASSAPSDQSLPASSDDANANTAYAMAIATLDRFQAGIAITDTPIGYSSPVGGRMNFTISYHQRLANQPTTFNHSNLGPQWQYSWISYITGGPSNGNSNATHYAPDGSQYDYKYYPVGTPNGAFPSNQGWTHGTLHYFQNPERYELWMPDGSRQKFAFAVGSSGSRQFFLTSIADPQNNVMTVNYDPIAAAAGNAVISSVADPLGNKLIFGYNSSNPLQITNVTRSLDGLSAQFGYTNGQLTSSTDPSGITSSFQYTSGTNFINTMTTPYGDTTFSSTDGATFSEADMTNPLGQTERVEYQENLSTSLFPDTEANAPSATGLNIDNSNLNQGNTFYWDRRAMSDATTSGASVDSAAFYALGDVTHWANGYVGTIPVPLSTKRSLEGRVWYNYPGQPDPDTVLVNVEGTSTTPSVVARLLDGGATQISQTSFNANGLPTQTIDPLGRTTNYNYDTNGLDLLTVKRSDGSGQDLLSTMTYNGQHLPLTITDAAGQTTSLSYYGNGQLKTITDSKNETTTLSYNSGSYLTSIVGPVSGATTDITYDSVGRIHTVTDSEGYALTRAYDNLDRLVSITYPDGTLAQNVYNKLDVSKQIDRQGRATVNQYDAIQELVQTTDPLGRITKYTWCTCGGLSSFTDANGKVTRWDLDREGRVTSKIYADSSQFSYVYETSMSRLHQMTDARGSVAIYAYNADNTLASTSYVPGSGVASTPNVSFTYDTPYKRLLTMADGTGTTTYAYNPINAAIGAGRLSSFSVPISGSSATVTYGYDEMGRVINRSIDGTTTNANNVSSTFDSLGRVTGVSSPLGAFTYAYVDATSRLDTVTYPNWQKTKYSYFDNVGDQRLKEINNYVWGVFSNTPLSDFQYTYNTVGTIATWQQQTDSNTPTQYALGYDNADQLTSSVQTNTSTSATVSSNAYNYDPAGNRLAETTLSATTGGQFNNLNQLTGLGSSSSETIAGNTSASVTNVMVNAVPATISNATNFSATVPLPTGTNVVTVVAQPTAATPPITTQRVQVVTSGTTLAALTYDANGNTLTDESGNTYIWDALNRLISITNSGGASSTFAYDGLSRRVQIVEKDATSTVTSTKNYLWVGSAMAEERDGSNVVTKRFFSQGEQQSGTNYYYAFDHLGSVRELIDGENNIQARYGYDPYGKTTLTSGTNIATFQYAGMYNHQPSGLNLAVFRAFDQNAGRWLSRDPIGEEGGTNLYGYVGNNPDNWEDSSGLAPEDPTLAAIHQKIVDEALSKVGSTDYTNDVANGVFPAGSYKCNKFVSDVANAAGAKVPTDFHKTWRHTYPPSPADWANPKVVIPGWQIVTTPQPGDIIARQIAYSDASGHVGIVVGPDTTVSTDDTNGLNGLITRNHFGFHPPAPDDPQTGPAVCRRYVGGSK